MNLQLVVVSLSALLLAVSGQLSTLSPSFSWDGHLSTTTNSAVQTTISFAVDAINRLEYETFSLLSATDTHYVTLHSENDSETFLVTNGVCTSSPHSPNILFPIEPNVWELFAAGDQDPIGTWTFTRNGIWHQVTMESGLPVSFAYRLGGIVQVITVTNFYNTTPDASLFTLPTECSHYDCSACYQNHPLSLLSPSYSFRGELVRTENGVQKFDGPYFLAVDVIRQLQFVDETVSSTGGITSDNIRISSVNDDITYFSANEVCYPVAYTPHEMFPVSTNVWLSYLAGTESPNGTYTFIDNYITHQVVMVNGKPASFYITFATTEINITVSYFNDTTPDFSTFTLPSDCSDLTCNSCFGSSAVSVSISSLLLLTTLLIYMITDFTTL
ncbi:hypothetical protein LOD99_14690 [Oopsacas minuta]|uniref:Uncharacterized protein n=1 Tax=Oopsacas minuta TaxID=111878 RepID=A0AAV7KG13_9METZ|nr:hypothetical protein LOD99_14690 [Oopsacas minuta]